MDMKWSKLPQRYFKRFFGAKKAHELNVLWLAMAGLGPPHLASLNPPGRVHAFPRNEAHKLFLGGQAGGLEWATNS